MLKICFATQLRAISQQCFQIPSNHTFFTVGSFQEDEWRRSSQQDFYWWCHEDESIICYFFILPGADRTFCIMQLVVPCKHSLSHDVWSITQTIFLHSTKIHTHTHALYYFLTSSYESLEIKQDASRECKSDSWVNFKNEFLTDVK